MSEEERGRKVGQEEGEEEEGATQQPPIMSDTVLLVQSKHYLVGRCVCTEVR